MTPAMQRHLRRVQRGLTEGLPGAGKAGLVKLLTTLSTFLASTRLAGLPINSAEPSRVYVVWAHFITVGSTSP